MRLTSLLAAPLFATSLFLTGCIGIDFDHGSSDKYQEDFHFSYDLQPNGQLVAETFNGKVEIIGWDENKVDISGTKYGSTERLRDSIKIDTHNSPSSVEVRAVHPSGSTGNSGARMTIKVPKQAVVGRVTSSNGAIRIEHVGAISHVKTSNATIRITDASGDLDARTSNAQIEVERFNGSLSARSSNGRIRAEGVTGKCDVETSNASIDVRMDHATAAPIRLTTSNGAIELALDKAPKSDIHAQSSNGSITLKMPGDTAAHITADTSNSSISSEFDILTATNGDRFKKDHLNGTLGNGGPAIDLETRNGSIRILKTTGTSN